MNETDFNWSELCSAVGPCIRPGGTELTERGLRVCRLPADALIADIGCGAGGTLQHLERSGHYRLLGVDQSEELLAEAAKRLQTARLLPGRAEAIPVSAETADALLCECVISILEDKGAAFGEFARVVKDGGYLVLSDVFRKGSHGGASLPSREELLQLLSSHGFSLLMWETHERLLREFAVRMIFSGHCLPEPWGCGKGQKDGTVDRSAIGYFLLVARKGDRIGGTA